MTSKQFAMFLLGGLIVMFGRFLFYDGKSIVESLLMILPVAILGTIFFLIYRFLNKKKH